MAARDVKVRLSADVAGFVAAMGKAAASAQQTGDRIAKAVDDKSASLNTVGNAALAMGGAMLAGVGLAVKGFADFDSQMSSVQSATMETDANMARLRETAMELGASTAFSATEAAQGMEELAKAGVSTEAIIGGGLAGSLDLAAAGQLSVAESAEIAATAMTQFGLSGEQVPHVADLLAAAAGKAQGSVHDMGMALNQSGLVASQYGVSIEETTGALAAFASAGLVGSDAGTSFKTMLMRLAAPTGEAKTLMDQLGISMYDAEGGFVGMDNIAAQLQGSLSGMSAEQRNAAMATLFGADAVRAANVLYSQGSEGIAEWVAAVDDQGYAAETAATKLDNLKGDLEALGGAFETAMIGMGAGADGPLRDLVQSVTGAVEAFNRLPDPVKQGVLAVAGFAGAGALAAGGLIKMVTSVADVASAFGQLKGSTSGISGKFSDIATSGGRAGTAIRALGTAAGVAAFALAGLMIAGAIQNSLPPFTASVDDLTGALLRLSDASTEAAALRDLDAAFDLQNGHLALATGQVEGLSEALQLLGQQNWMTGLDESFDQLTGATSSLTGRVKEQFGQIDQAMVQLGQTSAPQAAAAFEQVAKKAAAAELPLDTLVSLFPAYAQSVRDAATAQGITITSTEQLADLMASGLPAAADAATAAAGENAGAMQDQASAAEAARASLQALASQLLQQSGSLIGLEAAYDAAMASAEEHGKTLDLNTEAGRANQTALDGIAASALSYSDAATKAGAGTEEIRTNMDRARGTFIDVATSMGMTSEEAAALADAYGLIPPTVETEVTATGADQAKVDVATLGAAYQALPADKQTLISQMGAQDAQTAVQYLQLTLAGIPPEKAVQLVAEGTGQTVEQVQSVADTVNGVPGSKTVEISETGATPAKGRVEGLDGAVGSLSGKQITVTEQGANPATARVGGLQGSVRGLQGKTISVSEQGAVPATGRVGGLQGSVRGLQGKTVSVTANVSGQGAVDGLRGSIGSLASKTITVVTNFISRGTPGGNADGGLPIAQIATPAHIGAREFRDGGGFTGYGPRRVDRIPAWLSAHEYVQNDRAVDYYGLSVMEAMNRRLIPREAFSRLGFASGGSPSATAATTTAPVVSGPVLTRRDMALAVRDGLNAADVVPVARADYSLMGGPL